MIGSKPAIISAMALGLIFTNSALVSAKTFRQEHPRRAEVHRRDAGLNRQIHNDRGHLGGQYRRLEREDRGIRHHEWRDSRMNGGHITQGEKRQLNHEENHLQGQIDRDTSKRFNPNRRWLGDPGEFNRFNPGRPNRVGGVSPGGPNRVGVVNSPTPVRVGGEFAKNHPRRGEVLRRDNGLNNEIKKDKGHLDGQYSKLEKEDQSIRRQEQRDARRDGGHITSQEKQKLNSEENNLQKQINRDNSTR